MPRSHPVRPLPSLAFPSHWLQRNWCFATAAPRSCTAVREGWLPWIVAVFHHGLWLYSTTDQHKTNPFDTLLVKLLFIAQFLKSQWRTSDSWKGLLGGAEFQKSLSSLSLQEHRISCWKLQKQAPRNPSCISKPLPNFKQNPDINHRFLET